VISANSFWILLAEVDKALDPMDLELLFFDLLSRSLSLACAVDDEFDDILDSLRPSKGSNSFVMSKLFFLTNHS